MKFKSALVTAVSGSIGGLVGSHNAGGQYLRARTIPVNTNTSFQQAVRSYLALLAAAWSDSLEQAQRDAWENYAAQVPITDSLGEPRNISGIAHFLRSNVPRLQAGKARVDDGPTVYTLPSFTGPVFSPEAATDTVDVAFTNSDDWAGEVGGGMVLSASRPQGVGINYFRGPYRFMDIIPGAVSPPASPFNATMPFPTATGDKVFFFARVFRADGRLSSPFRASSTVAAS
jgi:hypothetical protein